MCEQAVTVQAIVQCVFVSLPSVVHVRLHRAAAGGVTAMLSPDWTLSAPRLSAAHSSRSLFSSCFADFFKFVLERKGMLLCSVLG